MRVSLMGKILRRTGGVLLLWLSLVSQTSAYDSRSSGSRRTQWVEIDGCILAASNATLQGHSRLSHVASSSYLLLHQRGRLVLQTPAGQTPLPYHRLWLKGNGAMFDKLVAEEQLFLNVRISGVLRGYQPDTGILDLVRIEVLP